MVPVLHCFQSNQEQKPMFKCETILFPIEFSQRDEAVAPFVLSMAQRYHAQVTVLHVLQPAPPVYAGIGAIYPETFDYEGLRQDLLIRVRKFAAAQLPKVEVECAVDFGDPASTISQYACANGIHLIAMPTHGYGTFRRALLGSVTAKVLHDSSVPVWTSAHAPEPSHRAHPEPRRIVCALDMKPESRHTLDLAIELAEDAGSALELVHVPAETVSADAAQHHLEDLLVEAAHASGVNVRDLQQFHALRQTESGSVADCVRNLALQERADLVVIGRGAIRTGLGRLHAHSYDIIRESPCPVLSV
jgi:nucleotide-binding universal stress UspA family protein